MGSLVTVLLATAPVLGSSQVESYEPVGDPLAGLDGYKLVLKRSAPAGNQRQMRIMQPRGGEQSIA